jgi:hypothetical protein
MAGEVAAVYSWRDWDTGAREGARKDRAVAEPANLDEPQKPGEISGRSS